ncbi:DUF1878 family protein [Fredinandcohnia humi]
METLEERIERIEFYQSLLIKLLDDKLAPFYKMMMEAKLSKKEIQDLLQLCEELSNEYKKQKAEGFVVFTPLLTQFVGMLDPKLEPSKTIEVLATHGNYTPLMQEFKSMIANIQ